jgi:hypothetical protein
MDKSFYQLLIIACALLILISGCKPTNESGPIVDNTGFEAPAVDSQIGTDQDQEQIETKSSWVKTYGSNNHDDILDDILITEEGDIFIVGATNVQFEPEYQGDIYLLKLDQNGEVLWEKTFFPEIVAAGKAIVPVSDGGFMITGIVNTPDTEGNDIFLLKTDQNGDELWLKIYNNPLDEWVNAFHQTQDGGYIIFANTVDFQDIVIDNPGEAGYPGFSGRSNPLILRVDKNGNEIWANTYESDENILMSGGLAAQDGTFFALGTILYYPEENDDIYLLKVDANGDEIWTRLWEEGTCSGHNIIQAADGNYIISSTYVAPEADSTRTGDSQFIKIDLDGNTIWTSIIGDSDMIEYGATIAATQDNNYIVALDRSRDFHGSPSNISLLKIDPNGELIWEQMLRVNKHIMLSEILQFPDGGYIIGGSVFDRTVNITLTKTDMWGLIDQQ